MARRDQSDPKLGGFGNYLEELLNGGYIDRASPAGGISVQVITNGVDSLSPEQAFVFDRDVVSDYAQRSCRLCGDKVPWCEMLSSLENGGLCSYCACRKEMAKAEDD